LQGSGIPHRSSTILHIDPPQKYITKKDKIREKRGNKRESEECGGCGGCGGRFKKIGRGIPPEKSFDFTPPDPPHLEHLPHVQDSIHFPIGSSEIANQVS
jgi:hypothetical protein